MASPGPVARKLGLLPPNMIPVPVATPTPGGIAAGQSPRVGAPVTETPPVAPGMLPQTSATPLYDATAPAPVASAEPADGGGWQGALQRALIGFSKGASRVEVDPTYNPVGAGLVGGLESTGASLSDAVNRKVMAQQLALKPYVEAQSEALKKSYEAQAQQPFKEKENQDTLNREKALEQAKYDRDTDPKIIEPLARYIATLAPSLRRVEIGRQAGPVAMVLENRVAAIRNSDPATAAADEAERKATVGLSDAELEKRYQAQMAGGVAEAAGAGGVRGSTGQQIGATVASMKDMLAMARPMMSTVSPTEIQAFNGLYQAGTREFNDPKQLAVDAYLTSAAGFYATLQKNGGVPDPVEREAAKKVLSSKLSEGGFAAVEQALNSEGASRAQRITETQPGVPPFHTPALGPVPTPVGTPASKKGSTWRHY